MKRIVFQLSILFLISNRSFSSEVNRKAILEMRQNLSLAFHDMTEELGNLNILKPQNKLYHDETMVSIAPQVGVKIPILVDLSFAINLRYVFKRKLPGGYAYNRP